jgi:hypothetical protein
LSAGVALVGRLSIPFHRSRMVLRDTVAGAVHSPKHHLSVGVAVVGRLANPIRCLGFILDLYILRLGP